MILTRWGKWKRTCNSSVVAHAREANLSSLYSWSRHNLFLSFVNRTQPRLRRQRRRQRISSDRAVVATKFRRFSPCDALSATPRAWYRPFRRTYNPVKYCNIVFRNTLSAYRVRDNICDVSQKYNFPEYFEVHFDRIRDQSKAEGDVLGENGGKIPRIKESLVATKMCYLF